MTGPTVRKASSFCDGLGNTSKGIVSPGQRRRKQGEKKQKGEIYRPDPVSWENYLLQFLEIFNLRLPVVFRSSQGLGLPLDETH